MTWAEQYNSAAHWKRNICMEINPYQTHCCHASSMFLNYCMYLTASAARVSSTSDVIVFKKLIWRARLAIRVGKVWVDLLFVKLGKFGIDVVVIAEFVSASSRHNVNVQVVNVLACCLAFLNRHSCRVGAIYSLDSLRQVVHCHWNFEKLLRM